MRPAEGAIPMETTYTFSDAGSGAPHMVLRDEGEPPGFPKQPRH
jgi:hypothetical protein